MTTGISGRDSKENLRRLVFSGSGLRRVLWLKGRSAKDMNRRCLADLAARVSEFFGVVFLLAGREIPGFSSRFKVRPIVLFRDFLGTADAREKVSR